MHFPGVLGKKKVWPKKKWQNNREKKEEGDLAAAAAVASEKKPKKKNLLLYTRNKRNFVSRPKRFLSHSKIISKSCAPTRIGRRNKKEGRQANGFDERAGVQQWNSF